MRDCRRTRAEEASPPGDERETADDRSTDVDATSRSGGRRWSAVAGRVGFFGLDLLGIAGWTWLAVAIPLPVFCDFLGLKNAIVAFVAVIWVGRTIVDTFFYDRYPW
jgi:hypothetical protein